MPEKMPFAPYPLGRLIRLALRRKGVSRVQLVQSMGYIKNITKGLRLLDQHISTPTLNPYFLKRLRNSLNLDDEIWADTVQSTINQAERENEKQRRKAFSPYIFVVTERNRPELGQFVISIFTGIPEKKIINLRPYIEFWPTEVKFKYVRRAIRNHRNEDRKQLVSFFGRITGYFYQAELGAGYWFSLDGEVLSEKVKGNHEIGFESALGGKKIQGSLVNGKEPQKM